MLIDDNIDILLKVTEGRLFVVFGQFRGYSHKTLYNIIRAGVSYEQVDLDLAFKVTDFMYFAFWLIYRRILQLVSSIKHGLLLYYHEDRV